MENESVRPGELALWLIMFEVGSTTLFLHGAKAKQDAWLSMLLAAAAGYVLLRLYLRMHRKDPARDLFTLCKTYFGRFLGTIAGLSFAVYFAYEASRNLRDLGELTKLTLLNRTPMYVTMALFVLICMYVAGKGLKGAILLCTALAPTILISYVILVLFTWSSGLIHFELMRPVLENGWGPILSEAFPDILSFPFGQVVLFLAFFNRTENGADPTRQVSAAYAAIAVFLILLNQIDILVLGPVLAENTAFPLWQVVQLIHFNRPLRMDPLFSLLLFNGLGFKLTAFLIGAAAGFEKLTGAGYRKWIVPIGAAVYGMAFISPNFTHHLLLGLIIWVTYIAPVFQIALPLLLLAAMMIRRKAKPA